MRHCILGRIGGGVGGNKIVDMHKKLVPIFLILQRLWIYHIPTIKCRI